MRQTRAIRLCLAGVLLVALVLLVVGCFGGGYPYAFFEDEKPNIQHALHFGAHGTLDPQWFNKPALGYYILFVEYGFYYMGGHLLGDFPSAEAFGGHFLSDISPFLAIGRVTVALFGVLTVLLTYFLGKRLRGRLTGLAAAACLALTLGQVVSSQQVKMDVPATFFSVWSAIFLVGVLTRGRWKDYLLAGFLAGLGVATKYYSIVLLVPLAYAHLFREPRALARAPRVFLSARLGAAVLALFGGFFVGSPYNFINPVFRRDFLAPQWRFVVDRFFGSATLASQVKGPLVDPKHVTVVDSVQSILERLLEGGVMGPVLMGLVGIGVLVAVRRRDRRDGFVLLTCVIVILFLAVGNRQDNQARHLTTLYPFLALLAGEGLMRGWRFAGSWLRRGRPARRGNAMLGALLVLALPIPGMPLWKAIAWDVHLLRPDPRVRALRWIEKNIPAGSVILNDKECLPLMPDAERARWALDRIGRLEQREWQGHPILRPDLGKNLRMLWEAELRGAGAESGDPRYDTVVLDHQWQTESLAYRTAAGAMYNPLWPRSPWGGQFHSVMNELGQAGLDPGRLVEAARRRFDDPDGDLHEGALFDGPVMLWSMPSRASKTWLTADSFERPGRSPGRTYQPVAWVATISDAYDNYDRPHKRANFPDFSAFYDDLRGHYDCYEFGPEGDPDLPTVRIYDLRERVETRTPRVIRMP